MTLTNSGTSCPRRRFVWALALVVAVCGVAFALWAATASQTSDLSADCVVVEDIARQWNTTSTTVEDILLNGGGQPDDFRSIADLQAEMAEKLRGAADSVSTPVIKEELSGWADGANQYAVLNRSVADRVPGTPEPPTTENDFERVARSMIDNATALGKSCPGMSAT